MALSVKHGLLGILAVRPCHGYELKTEFDQLTGGLWELNVGQVYSTLERLLKDGLIATLPSEPGGEDRRVYEPTPQGLAELDAWLSEPPTRARPLRDELYVHLGLLLERDLPAARQLIEQQRRLYHLQMADLTRQKLQLSRASTADRLRQQPLGPPRGGRWRELVLDAALLHLEADLKWMDHCEERLQTDGP